MRIASFILSAILFFTGALTGQSQPAYEVYGIRYATLKGFEVSSLVKGADPARKMDLAMMVWLIKGQGKVILFDAGFYSAPFIKAWHPADYVKPSEVTDVVISHIHWDHADGFDLFPKAKVWIQKDELEYYAGSAWQGHKRTAADPDVLLRLVKWNTQGRVNLVKGDAQEIFPGITAYIGGKHTYQSQYISVKTAAGPVVLASDNMYLYENLDKHLPIGTTLDAESNLRAQERMRTLATSERLIVPGHDPAVMTRFKEVGPRMVRVE